MGYKTKQQQNEYNKAWYKTKKGKRCERDNGFRKLYGISLEQWEKMLIEQSGRCSICGVPMRNPHVDHDHKTGMVRDLLCSRCNRMLGVIEDVEFTSMARRYLVRHEASASIKAEELDSLNEPGVIEPFVPRVSVTHTPDGDEADVKFGESSE